MYAFASQTFRRQSKCLSRKKKLTPDKEEKCQMQTNNASKWQEPGDFAKRFAQVRMRCSNQDLLEVERQFAMGELSVDQIVEPRQLSSRPISDIWMRSAYPHASLEGCCAPIGCSRQAVFRPARRTRLPCGPAGSASRRSHAALS